MNVRRVRLSKHHIRPRSRFPLGTRDYVKDWFNIVELPVTFHRALHHIFGNLDPRESEELLRRVLVPGMTWDERSLHNLRLTIMEETCLTAAAKAAK